MPQTQHRRHRPMYHTTTEPNYSHNHGVIHHPNDRHNWPTHKHLPPVSYHFIINTTHNPQTTRQTHPICLPLVPKKHPLQTQNTWHRLQAGPPLGKRHDLEQPFLHHQWPNTIKYPPALLTKTSPYPTAVARISTRNSATTNCSRQSNLPITNDHRQMAPPSSPAPPGIDQSPY